jgi:phage/plasmid-like protein (TIGR03299 family)
MPAEISYITVDGKNKSEAVFGFGEIPWWNSAEYPAIVLDRAVSFDEVFSIAFPWEALQEQLQYADGSLSTQWGIRRSDTLAELGVHSEHYGNIQPRSLFDFCAAFFEENKVPISSAISMKGGKVLNISARVGEIDILGSGDIHKTYLCFVNSFDGSLKAQPYISAIQPVCMNTTRSGLASASAKLGYKHTKNVERRIKADISQAAMLMTAQQATTERLQEVFNKLAQVKPTREVYNSLLDDLFGKEDEAAKSGKTRLENTKKQFTELVAYGVNAQKYPDFKGTGYGLYCAYTDYIDHNSQVRVTDSRQGMSDVQIRMERSLIGNEASKKERCLEMLEKVLVLADGSVEEPKKYYYTPKPVQDTLYTPTDVILSQPIDITYQETPIEPLQWDMDATEQALEQELTSEEPTIPLYTTAPSHFDCPETITNHIAEQISAAVAMRCVMVPAWLANEQMSLYKEQGCACFTADQWAALKGN